VGARVKVKTYNIVWGQCRGCPSHRKAGSGNMCMFASKK